MLCPRILDSALQLLHILIVCLLQLLYKHFGLDIHLSPLFRKMVALIRDRNHLFLNLRVFGYLYEFRFCLQFLRRDLYCRCVLGCTDAMAYHLLRTELSILSLN